MPIPLSHIIAFACFSYITDLLVWLIPFIFNPSDYVPQIDSPVPDQLNNGLMTYVPHPLITLPMLPQLTTPAPSGYFDIQPTSPIPLGYFGPMMELSTTLEPPCGKLCNNGCFTRYIF
jgi:hypothetical protein